MTGVRLNLSRIRVYPVRIRNDRETRAETTRGDFENAQRDLFSYVLFDAEYTTALCDLGYQDARRREDDLVRFFSD
jgi:hypothetical protein